MAVMDGLVWAGQRFAGRCWVWQYRNGKLVLGQVGFALVSRGTAVRVRPGSQGLGVSLLARAVMARRGMVG